MVEVDSTGKTIFRFCHKTQGPVFLSGDFCQWQTDHLPMRRVGEHEWLLMLRLPPGSYEFRYFADGTWFTDFAAFGVTQNQFKEWNSVLRVPKVRPALHVAAPVPARSSVRRLAASA
jgi:hypothetical protein